MAQLNTEKLLIERVKELKCLFTIAKLCQNQEREMFSVLQEAIDLLPFGWMFPEKLKTHLQFDEYTYNHEPTHNLFQRAHLIINGEIRGAITVFYPSENSESSPFLYEEQELLNYIGIELSSYIERYKQREREKEIAEVIKSADRLSILAELTAGIAHEINTPLGNILGYAELLQKGETNQHKLNDLKKIITSAKNAREIVKRLMYFSCEIPQKIELIDLNKLISENISLLHRQLEEKRISLTLNLDPSIESLHIDALQFTQVLFNLILNAIDAAGMGGKITIHTFEENNATSLVVEDNGRGISPEIKAKIFQPFFTTKKTIVGTGLGLSVVHGIVQAHGATISVQSEPNKSTKFIISFPKKNT